MYHSIYIFIIAFIVRILNLHLNEINADTYLIEDQLMYWDWSLNNAFTSNGIVDPKLLLERMPGSFLFFQFAIWIVGDDLFRILVIQIIIDSLTCLTIAFIAKTLNKSFFILAGIVAAFSPLMIIISSQILSDTIFLFFFSISILGILKFSKYKKERFIYLGAIFLSLALFTRAVVLPFIFLIPILIFYICYKEKHSILKIIKITSIFFIISLSFATPRIINNYYNFNTLSLTSQSGAHLAYWVLPAILDFDSEEKKTKYKKKLEELNTTIETLDSPFDQSELLKKEAFNFLLAAEKKIIFLAWSKGALMNTFGPPFIIDKRFRDLPHPSFYGNDRNLVNWITRILKEDKFKKYKVMLCITVIFSVFFILLFFYGLTLLYKNYFKTAVIFSIISLYFLGITGPVFSPKYIHPILPVLITFEVIALRQFFEFFVKSIINTKRN